jgi:hypothetical protein
LKVAKLPIHRDLVNFKWDETPLAKQQIEQLATALGVAAIHHEKRVRFYNAGDNLL